MVFSGVHWIISNENNNEMEDFGRSIAEFKRNGMAILPVKVDPLFVQKSKDLCLSAYQDALNRVKLVLGHELKVGQEHGFQEIIARAQGRYELFWKIQGEKHFVDEENVLTKFMPFVENILGKYRMRFTNIYSDCIFSLGLNIF